MFREAHESTNLRGDGDLVPIGDGEPDDSVVFLSNAGELIALDPYGDGSRLRGYRGCLKARRYWYTRGNPAIGNTSAGERNTEAEEAEVGLFAA